MNYAIILAGGVGSRFWPLSRAIEPKQFLNICSSRPMLEEAIRKISPVVNPENIYIATNFAHRQKVKSCMRGLKIPSENILFEPATKNTLAPIAVLTEKIYFGDQDAVILVLPCDHFIRDKQRFLHLLKKAMDIARAGRIVTFGFSPKRPETGYGYIKTRLKPASCKPAYEVERFIEKPVLAVAEKFIRDKHYYWNSGIFIFRADTMLGEIRSFTPRVYGMLAKALGKDGIKKIWQRMPSISVDYAIMEKTRKAVLLPADYGWMDLGSWQAIVEVMKKNKQNNIFRGNCIDIGSKNTLSWSTQRLVATVGLDGIIVVDTKDALLVCALDKAQEVKKVIGLLKQRHLRKQI